VEADTRTLLQRRSLLKLGVAVPLAAAGVVATSSAATADTTADTTATSLKAIPDSRTGPTECEYVYVCDSYFYITDTGTVFFCEDLCDVDTDAYCETVCSQCG